jgi:hypothetical protein
MTDLIELFKEIVANYGIVTAIFVLVIVGFLYIIITLKKTYTDFLKKYLENRVLEKEKAHTDAALYRKRVLPKIRKELNHLATETSCNRALLFEFSNGSCNLVGLPFLYVTATCEVVTANAAPVLHKYQKLNTSVIAQFLEALEQKGYFYTKNIEDIKDVFPTVYALMKPNGVKSAMFYSLYGVDDTIGFITITTIGDNDFPRDGTITKIANSAQVISSLLNYSKIQENE